MLKHETEHTKRSQGKCRGLQFQLVSEEIPKIGRILDVGCGGGHRIISLNRVVYGIDMDVKTLTKIKNTIPFGILVGGTALNLPFKDDCFDTVILEETIEHLHREDQKKCVEEIHRVLKRGGKFVCSTPNRPIYRLLRWIEKYKNLDFEDGFFKYPLRRSHFAELRVNELKNLLDIFRNVKIKGINPYLNTENPYLGIGLLAVGYK